MYCDRRLLPTSVIELLFITKFKSIFETINCFVNRNISVSRDFVSSPPSRHALTTVF